MPNASDKQTYFMQKKFPSDEKVFFCDISNLLNFSHLVNCQQCFFSKFFRSQKIEMRSRMNLFERDSSNVIL